MKEQCGIKLLTQCHFTCSPDRQPFYQQDDDEISVIQLLVLMLEMNISRDIVSKNSVECEKKAGKWKLPGTVIPKISGISE